MWLEPFMDRVRGQDDLTFDVEYRIEFLGTEADPLRTQQNVCAAAVRAIVEASLARWDVLRPVAAGQDVNLELARLLPREESGVLVTRASIVVHADAEMAESAKRFTEARQAVNADAVERHRLRNRMAFLEEEVLRDQASLRLFLLAEGIGPGKAVTSASIAELEGLAEVVRRWSPTNKWVETAKILHEHFDSLPPDAVLTLISTLRDSIRDHDNQRLLGRFDAVHSFRDDGTRSVRPFQ